MSITVEKGDEEVIVYVPVENILRAEMLQAFEAALLVAEPHLRAAQQAEEPLATLFANAVKAISDAATSLKQDGQIPSVGGNSPGEDDVSSNPFSRALLSAYGFSQTDHKRVNPNSIKGFISLQPVADLMHRHCIYT